MCDLFQANPWKPLLCANCHQNRSGHSKINNDMPSSTSSMHLYEEIMAQYFTINSTTEIESLQSTSFIECQSITENVDEDSFSDEEQDLNRTNTVEFIANQSMINTQGIVLMGPDLRIKETPKKSKKMHLLRKSKSNADECLKKTETTENTPSKLRWFKTKKSSPPSQGPTEPEKPNLSPTPTQPARIRVLPEINKLTINEGNFPFSSCSIILFVVLSLALSIARRQHSSSKLPSHLKPVRSPALLTGHHSHYGSSIASTTSSSTQSSTEYETTTPIKPSHITESPYLVATASIETNPSLLDQIIRLTVEHLSSDLSVIIDEYKQNLPVSHFQTLKCVIHQHQTTKLFSNQSIFYLLLQLITECSIHSNASTFEHFLLAHHSTLPIVVTTTATTMKNEEQSIEQMIRTLAQQLFDSTSMPNFTDLSALETLCCQSLASQIFQYSSTDFDQSLSMQRVKLLEQFWTHIPSLRQMQINEENERVVFLLYHMMRRMI